MFGRERQTVAISSLTEPADGGDLTGMTSPETIELLVLAREAAKEAYQSGDRDRYEAIKAAYNEVLNGNIAADGYDGGHQCNDRELIRRGKI